MGKDIPSGEMGCYDPQGVPCTQCGRAIPHFRVKVVAMGGGFTFCGDTCRITPEGAEADIKPENVREGRRKKSVK
eukprot:g46624.t1